jgi:hypothetical protein
VTAPGEEERTTVPDGTAGADGSGDRSRAADPPPGEGIVRAALVGTAIFVVVAVAAALSRPVFSMVAVVVSLALFAVGCGTFLWAYGVAVQRSRVDSIGMGGLFFLQGSAPRRVQRLLVGAAALQVAVAVATAAAHPFTSQAFVILVPMYGLGLSGLWGAKHGTFAARDRGAAR